MYNDMKLIFSITLLSCFLSMQAQTHFEARITYKNEIKYLREEFRLSRDSLIKANGSAFRDLLINPSKVILSLKKDSVLVQDYIDDTIAKNILLSTKDIYIYI